MQLVNTKAFRWTMDATGDWLCVQTNKARQVLDALKEGQVYDVEIKEHREKRSLDANGTSGFWLTGWLKSCGFPRRIFTGDTFGRSAAIMKWSA